MKNSLLILLFFGCNSFFAQNVTEIQPLPDQYWWGGVTVFGLQIPYVEPFSEFNLATQNRKNQVVPLLVSDKERYVWSNFYFKFSKIPNGICISSDFEKVNVNTTGTTLKSAYLDACQKHFKPSGVLPDSLFFTAPQYNTWIELTYNSYFEKLK